VATSLSSVLVQHGLGAGVGVARLDGRMVDLEPSASDLANLLMRMTDLEWPTTEEERLFFFASLGLHDVESPRPDDTVVCAERRWFASDLSDAVSGTATMFRGEFLGLAVFAYNEPVENGPLTRAGYTAVRDHVNQRLGLPVEEWGTATEPACLWAARLADAGHVLLPAVAERDHGRPRPRRPVRGLRRGGRHIGGLISASLDMTRPRVTSAASTCRRPTVVRSTHKPTGYRCTTSGTPRGPPGRTATQILLSLNRVRRLRGLASLAPAASAAGSAGSTGRPRAVAHSERRHSAVIRQEWNQPKSGL